MNNAPSVPVWLAVLVGVTGSMVGAALAFNDPSIIFLTPTVKFLLFLANTGLMTFAVMLNIRVPGGTTVETKVTTTVTPPTAPPAP